MVQVLDFPRTVVPPPKTATWRMAANTQAHVSPLDQTVQTIELPGAHWVCDAAWVGLNAPEWRAFESFIAQLRGAAGRFYYGPPHAWAPRGNAGGTPMVAGGSQLGSQLFTAGWNPGFHGVLRIGDYFSVDTSIGRELKIVRNDVDIDATGNAYLVFDPPLRRSPPNGTAVIMNRPTTIMRLANDEQGAFDHEEGGYANVSLQLIEVF